VGLSGPTRTCVGCRETAPKPTLIRVVRSASGAIVDPSGAASGRGAYVHASGPCVARAIERDALARSLRMGLAVGELGRLRELSEGDV
jgi:hypothetical protein